MSTEPLPPDSAADPLPPDAAAPETVSSETAPPETGTSEIGTPEGALAAELAEMKDRWMRSEAELANVRARARREVEETRQYAVQKFARDIAEAAENLQRGLASIPAPQGDEPELVGKLREGFEGVERALMAVLERNGIKRVDPTGASFDPNLHQAMAEHESSEHPPGTVLQAWTPAWTLNGRLLRPAMVVVSKAPPTEIGAAGADAAPPPAG